ncbi:MAG: peptide deformylase [Proteobacteria bacterium]|nr:peptide deformylase [Pseudomonadota bacterium]
MSILKVARMGHPVLRQVAVEVPPELIPSEVFQRFCDDLLETMDEYDGAGLAAPQVHELLRVCVLTLSDERGPEFLINPVITVLSDETQRYYEGCLSVTDMRAAVDRPSHIRLEALGRDGQPKAYELQGFAAIVTQHECDHLDGVLFVDKCDTTTLAFLEEYRRWGPLDEMVDGDIEDDQDWEDDDLSDELEEA